MTLRVFISPHPDTMPGNSGIGRVVHAQYALLPKYDIELMPDASRADVSVYHAPENVPERLSVMACHGLYWSGDPDSGKYDNWHHTINARLVASARRASLVTVPSDWVAQPFRRDLRISPRIVPHGVDTELWKPAPSRQLYALWAKNRSIDVCDPTPALELANRGFPVISTFAPSGVPLPENLTVTGAVPELEMRDLVSHAHIYLATTKETFGIGTLEAMSAGVPVVGFDWGGTRDLVTNGVDGMLVRPNDYDALASATQWAHENRNRLSDAARAKAKRYTWERACEMYAGVFREAAEMERARTQRVCIVVTTFQYGHYLDECLRSLLVQTELPAEVIVVDDASSDDSTQVANGFAQRFALAGIAYGVLTHSANTGVAQARNDGVAASTCDYITCLDADDRLHPLYVAACKQALSADSGLGIAYTGLGMIRPDGRVSENKWLGEFDWEWQAEASVPPHTTIPTAAMFRKSAWSRCGGYRQRYAPGEDAEFYTRLLSLGWTAQRVTDSPLIEYRNHGAGAHQTRPYVPVDDDKPWMRDGLYPLGAPSKRPPLVRSYSDPLVSVFIEWGKLPAFLTIDSIIGQTWREWEIVVPSDHDKLLAEYPFLRTQKSPSSLLCIVVKGGEVLDADYLANELRTYIARESNFEWNEEVGVMGPCCGGLDAKYLAQLSAAKQATLSPLPVPAPEVAEVVAQATASSSPYVRMEFIGRQVGAATYNGKPNTGRSYRAGNNDMERYVNVHREDVEFLAAKGVFRVVNLPRQVTHPQAIVAATPVPQPALSVEEELIQRPARKESKHDNTANRWPVAQPTVPSSAKITEEVPEHEYPLGDTRPQAVPDRVQDVRQEVTGIPKLFQRYELPPELESDALPVTPDAPITVHVERAAGEEDDAAYDRRVMAAIEAERKRRASG